MKRIFDFKSDGFRESICVHSVGACVNGLRLGPGAPASVGSARIVPNPFPALFPTAPQLLIFYAIRSILLPRQAARPRWAHYFFLTIQVIRDFLERVDRAIPRSSPR